MSFIGDDWCYTSNGTGYSWTWQPLHDTGAVIMQTESGNTVIWGVPSDFRPEPPEPAPDPLDDFCSGIVREIVGE